MNKINDILNELSNNSSSLNKISVLENNADNKILRDILYFTYNTFIKYYIVKIPILDGNGKRNINDSQDWNKVKILLQQLYSRTITGNESICTVKKMLEDFDIVSQDVLIKIIQRDLKVGISESTINKVFEDLIPTFDVALANHYEGKQDIFNGKWLVSKKLDGCRCVVIKENGVICSYSRAGNVFTTLKILENELSNILKNVDNVVLDGEICIVDKNGKEDFAGIMKEIKRKDHTIQNPRYFIFDYLTTEEFYNKKSNRILSERRKELLQDIKENNYVKILKQEILTKEKFADLLKAVKENNWEGLIVRLDTHYQGKRSNDLLKIKSFFDAEYKVLETVNEEITFSEDGKQKTETMLSAVIIEHKGNKVNVGSGFSREERRLYFKNPKAIIGKTIQVKYFEETKNQNGGISLRFPTIAHIYENGRNT